MAKLSPLKLSRKMKEEGISSLQALGKKSGLHRNTLYPLMRGERSPFSSSYLRLCQTLGVSPIELLEEPAGSALDVIGAALQRGIETFDPGRQSLAFCLFGSRATGKAKRFSDYDVGVTGGERPLDSKLFLKIKEYLLSACDDLAVKVDLVNFDQAPLSFVLDFDSPLSFIAGYEGSMEYLKGKIDGLKANQKAA
jgi:predicted nucleotidyltransferase